MKRLVTEKSVKGHHSFGRTGRRSWAGSADDMRGVGGIGGIGEAKLHGSLELDVSGQLNPLVRTLMK